MNRITHAKATADNDALRSDAVRELISRRPGFIERRGLSLLLVFLLVLYGAAWFIRYPDTVAAYATIIASDTRTDTVRLVVTRGNPAAIDTGQEVQLLIDGYPSGEFGFIRGRISAIRRTSSDSGFVAIAALPDGFLTSTHRMIPTRRRLTARALIFTKEERLAQRIFEILAGGRRD
jgi:hypothetical protein